MFAHFKLSALRQSRPHEYVLRFALGGLATVIAGIVADVLGPAAGGLMLAFPAIFCASATLVEKHERQRKADRGLQGNPRSRGGGSGCGRRDVGQPGPREFWRGHLAAGGNGDCRYPRDCFVMLVPGRGRDVVRAACRLNMKADIAPPRRSGLPARQVSGHEITCAGESVRRPARSSGTGTSPYFDWMARGSSDPS